MSTYVMSDIHGCGKQYHEMLEKIGFSDEDRLYIIGDVIDRGPDGAELLVEIMKQTNIFMLLGNHELMMLDALVNGSYDNWLANQCMPTMAGINKLEKAELIELLKWVADIPCYENVSVGERSFQLVHACPPAMCDADEFRMVWDRVAVSDVHNPLHMVIFGHTPTMFYRPGITASIIKTEDAANIDCGCAFGGRLACLRLDDMAEFYVDGPLT